MSRKVPSEKATRARKIAKDKYMELRADILFAVDKTLINLTRDHETFAALIPDAPAGGIYGVEVSGALIALYGAAARLRIVREAIQAEGERLKAEAEAAQPVAEAS